MLAAALITYNGEFLLTYLTPSGTDVWAVFYHPERLDLTHDVNGGFCSVGFSTKRAMALDRRGTLIAVDLYFDSGN
jgi:hypothetical protein